MRRKMEKTPKMTARKKANAAVACPALFSLAVTASRL
jgi:hypothetical protein